MTEMNFLETLKTFVPKDDLFKKNGVYLLSTNLGFRRIINGRYTCKEELRKVLVEEVREQEANPEYFIERKHWCPDDASWDEIRVRLESLSIKADISHSSEDIVTIEEFLEQQEPMREAWHYC